MANTLGGINLASIAQRTLDALVPYLIDMRQFFLDFSDELGQPGASITTRVPTATTADDVSGGFTAEDQTSTAVTITLNKELGKAIAFTPAELSKGGEELVIRTFVPTVINAVGLGVIQEGIKLMTSANFSALSTIASAAFDADDMADLAQACDEANVSPLGRFALLKPAWYTALIKDDVVQHVDSSGSSEALRDHRVSRVSGFRMSQFNGFPGSGDTFDQNLCGFVGHSSAICYAARMPVLTAAGRQIVDAVDVIEPNSGFPMQFQEFYVPTTRKHYYAVATLFGVSVGLAGAGRRIRSAAP